MPIPKRDQRTRDGRGKGEGQAGAEPEQIPVGSGIKLGGSDDPGPVAQRGLSPTSPELRGLEWGAAEPDGATGLGRLPQPQISLELRAGPAPVYLSCQGLPPHTFLIGLVV